jgi:hypothetical protein
MEKRIEQTIIILCLSVFPSIYIHTGLLFFSRSCCFVAGHECFFFVLNLVGSFFF